MMVFAVPALIAFGIAVIHTVLVGREIARPLMQQQTLPPIVTLTHYYCLHMATISLAVLAGCYAYTAVSPVGRIVAAVATMVSSAFHGRVPVGLPMVQACAAEKRRGPDS